MIQGKKERERDCVALTYVVPQTKAEHEHRESPEDGAERLRYAQLVVGGLVLDVEGERDGDGDDGHVDGESEVRQECCFSHTGVLVLPVYSPRS